MHQRFETKDLSNKIAPFFTKFTTKKPGCLVIINTKGIFSGIKMDSTSGFVVIFLNYFIGLVGRKTFIWMKEDCVQDFGFSTNCFLAHQLQIGRLEEQLDFMSCCFSVHYTLEKDSLEHLRIAFFMLHFFRIKSKKHFFFPEIAHLCSDWH